MNSRLFLLRSLLIAALLAAYFTAGLALRHLTAVETTIGRPAVSAPLTNVAAFALWPLVALPALHALLSP